MITVHLRDIQKPIQCMKLDEEEIAGKKFSL